MPEKLVTIATFASSSEATTAKALLEVRGIAAVLVGGELANVLGPLTPQLIDPVKLEVFAADVVEAQRLIEKLKSPHAFDREGAASIEPAEPCLQCGATMTRPEGACEKCGWTYAGERTTDYENGPVPDALLAFVHSPLDSRRFALPADAAKRYVRWCLDQRYEIRGFEVWLPNFATHTVVQVRDRGDRDDLLAAIPAAIAELGPKVLFCVFVVKEAE